MTPRSTTPEPRTPRQFISLNEASARLGVAPRTIRRMISRGELTGYRVGTRILRVDGAQVDSALRKIPSAGDLG